MNAQAPSVSERLDRIPAGWWLWRRVIVISLGAFFEIYDVNLAAPLSLGLAKAGVFASHGLFGLSDQASFIALTFAGLWLGALVFSAIADRFGRRPIFAGALLWYALATVVMGLQSSALAIDAWRFVASLGVGVELVAIDCYLAELAPKRSRGRVFAISSAIQFLSAPALAVLAWLVIPGMRLGIDGWRWLAFAPGLGAILAWRARLWLPESPRWLAAHGREDEAQAVLADIEAEAVGVVGASLPAPDPEPPAPDQAATHLFLPPLRRRTLTLIGFHLFQTLGYYGFFAWLPTLLVARGVPLNTTLAYGVMLAAVPPLAPFAFALFADRFERKWLIVGGAGAAAAFGLAMGVLSPRADLLLYTLVGGATAAGASLMSLAYHAYQAELFPTPVRARAVGLVYSFSRLSAAGSAYLVAYVLATHGATAVFALVAGAMALVCAIIALAGPRTTGMALEEI